MIRARIQTQISRFEFWAKRLLNKPKVNQKLMELIASEKLKTRGSYLCWKGLKNPEICERFYYATESKTPLRVAFLLINSSADVFIRLTKRHI